MDKLSVILITGNEEGNVRDCLESVKWADEIILVDQSSTDKTVEIAKKYTDRIYTVERLDTSNPSRHFAISKTSYDWVLLIDADERVSKSLKEEIIAILKSPHNRQEAYYINRKTFFLGKWIRGCGWYPSYTIRLFKRGKAAFPAEVFHDGQPLSSCGYLKEHFLHYSYRSLEEYFAKSNRYSSIVAVEEYKKGLRVNRINFVLLFIIKPIYWFFKKYFFLKGFMDGMRGFFISLFGVAGIVITYAKLWEMQQASLKNNR